MPPLEDRVTVTDAARSPRTNGRISTVKLICHCWPEPTFTMSRNWGLVLRGLPGQGQRPRLSQGSRDRAGFATNRRVDLEPVDNEALDQSTQLSLAGRVA